MNKGKLIVIDGLDGSGKKTQAMKLVHDLENLKLKAKYITFPNYDAKSSTLVKMYLNGELGSDPSKLSPYAVSDMYALDRYISYLTEWKEYYDKGYWIVADRYSTSNMIIQGACIDVRDRFDFYSHIINQEFHRYRLPVPDRFYFLDVPVDMSIENMKERNDNKHGGTDIIEENDKFIREIYEASRSFINYLNKSELFINISKVIKCAEKNEIFNKELLLGINPIHNMIMNDMRDTLLKDAGIVID